MATIDAEPGQPEVHYFDDATRERVLAKRRSVKAIAGDAPAKPTKKTAAKTAAKG